MGLIENNPGLKVEKMPFSRNYKLVMVNGGLSRMGTAGFQLTILWIALVITNSPVLAGFADGMAALPLFFSFIFGAYVDSLNSKRGFAVLVSAVRVLSIFALFLAVLINNLFVETLSIYFVAFVIGLSTDILNSTRASWSKQFLVESQYQSGVSLSQSLLAVTEGIGYAISGVLIILGISYAVYSFAIIFAVSTVPIIMLRGERSEHTSREGSIQESMISGMKFIFGDTRLRALIIIILVINLAFGTIGIFLVYLVDKQFGLPAIYYTTIALSLTVGMFAGSAMGSKVKGKVGFYSIATILPIGILLFLMGSIDSVYPDYPIAIVMGTLVGIANVVVSTSIMHIVDQEMMGRVNGAVNTFAISLTFVSGAIGGALIQALTLHGAFLLIGGIIVAASFLPAFFRDFYDLRV